MLDTEFPDAQRHVSRAFRQYFRCTHFVFTVLQRNGEDGQTAPATQIGAVGMGQLTQMIDKALGSQAA